jgi:hypothetical protein
MISQRGANILGGIGTGCFLFTLSWLLLPKSTTRVMLPLLDWMGPFQWLILLAMIILPIVAARRGSKWWWVVAIISTGTFVRLLLMVH